MLIIIQIHIQLVDVNNYSCDSAATVLGTRAYFKESL